MSKNQTEIEKIRDTKTHFHWAQENGDETAFLSVWHPEAKRFGLGECVGFHYTYYHLAKTEDNWVIVNVTDRAKIPS